MNQAFGNLAVLQFLSASETEPVIHQPQRILNTTTLYQKPHQPNSTAKMLKI